MPTCIPSRPLPDAIVGERHRPTYNPEASAKVCTWILRPLRLLAANPTSLVATVVAINALFMPVRCRYHDATLYRLQVTNRVDDGRFSSDLFLAYGSQDRYSLFSLASAPIASVCGVPLTLFLFYLGGTALYFWALQRLLRAVISDDLIIALGLIGVAVCPPAVGGLGIFHVYENFMTPRLLASGAVLLALERMLAGRWVIAIVCLIAASTLHPLVACSGWLVLLSWQLLSIASRRWLLGFSIFCVLATSLVLFVPAVGNRVLGPMDAAWREEVRLALPCLFAAEWETGDWLQVLLVFGVMVAAWRWLPLNRAKQNFLAAQAIVIGLGAAGTVAAGLFPYALLLQGQPFRAFWLGQTLCLPLALLLARTLWESSLELRQLAARFWPALIIVVGFGLATATITQESVLASSWSQLRTQLDFDVCLRAFVVVLNPLLLFLLAVFAAVLITRVAGFRRTLQLCCALIFLVIQTSAFALQQIAPLRAFNQTHYSDISFARDVLANSARDTSEVPSIYWPIGHVDYVWFDLAATSYFTQEQLVGNVFSCETAMEGRRRADLVKPFELDLYRRKSFLLSDRRLSEIEQLFHGKIKGAAPCADDLFRLCSDSRLDYAILGQAFPHLYSATNGNWFIYDCQQVRSSPEYAAFLKGTE